MQRLAEAIESLPGSAQQELHFALGKAYADLQQYELSFRHLVTANALKRRETAYNEPEMLRSFDRIRAVFTPELLKAKRGLGDPSTVPIFIVGMPRSGTTLVEQILASHPQVFGAGERNDFSRVAEGLQTHDAALRFPRSCPCCRARHCVTSADAIWPASLRRQRPRRHRARRGSPTRCREFRLCRVDNPGSAECAHHSRSPRSDRHVPVVLFDPVRRRPAADI